MQDKKYINAVKDHPDIDHPTGFFPHFICAVRHKFPICIHHGLSHISISRLCRRPAFALATTLNLEQGLRFPQLLYSTCVKVTVPVAMRYLFTQVMFLSVTVEGV